MWSNTLSKLITISFTLPIVRVASRRPCPRSRVQSWEFLSIDARRVAQVCTRREFVDSAPLRDTAIFEEAGHAYPAVGLTQHLKKKRRGVSSGIFLGADADGLAGLVSAPWRRLGVIIWINAVIAHRGAFPDRAALPFAASCAQLCRACWGVDFTQAVCVSTHQRTRVMAH